MDNLRPNYHHDFGIDSFDNIFKRDFSQVKVSDFDYFLPEEKIAQFPSQKRDHSRLMVLNRKTQAIEHKLFYQITEYFKPGDLLVLNNTKVIPASIIGKKESGSAVIDVLLIKQIGASVWECLVKPGKRLKEGARIIFGDGKLTGKVIKKTESGGQIIEFDGDLFDFVKTHGKIPLPPYIKKMSNDPSAVLGTSKCQMTNEKGKASLFERYQTVYAKKEGASAAPTAGLHFTPELLGKIKQKGVNIAYVTLHTGLATFKPVYAENVHEHKMYEEKYEIPPETVKAIKEAKRIIAVGTTTVRTLETLALQLLNAASGFSGETDLFIYPGFKFKIVDAMITNFHFPRSTLLMLVSAFAGKEFIQNAYKEALNSGYRFFSFGDAMLII
ncbi:MAG: S-adenosylmethionine:tRNA ribosyltransferase-isomerase [Candidatus Saganbacteria bacterium]|uniref:S-adenosylmethionine:tRNA ribosyltransferase-isomerase n=1 Tax=Candidatus Saganbacteria bacterium TaxID=2575572 RepID=A0A833NXI8_UNCSA|nr:MAG: S-adenosylmethionine:tRNA ribosyltransferase-isomerase [Candidatus Saganbacteria bacterium]